MPGDCGLLPSVERSLSIETPFFRLHRGGPGGASQVHMPKDPNGSQCFDITVPMDAGSFKPGFSLLLLSTYINYQGRRYRYVHRRTRNAIHCPFQREAKTIYVPGSCRILQSGAIGTRGTKAIVFRGGKLNVSVVEKIGISVAPKSRTILISKRRTLTVENYRGTMMFASSAVLRHEATLCACAQLQSLLPWYTTPLS